MTYWLTYRITLLSYLIFSIGWISIAHTMPALPKIIGTSVCALVVVVYGIVKLKRKFWNVIPLSLFMWAFVVDSVIGTWFHGSLFYLSETTWPDRIILEIFHNGVLYALLKGWGIIISWRLSTYNSG